MAHTFAFNQTVPLEIESGSPQRGSLSKNATENLDAQPTTSLGNFNPSPKIIVNDFDPDLSDAEFLDMFVKKMKATGLEDFQNIQQKHFHTSGGQKIF